MTVQELIDKLQQVEDKSKEALLYTAWVDPEGDYMGTDYCTIEYKYLQRFCRFFCDSRLRY